MICLCFFFVVICGKSVGIHIRRLGYKGPKRSFGAVKIFLEGTAVFVWGHAHNIFEIRVETAGIVLIPYLFGNKRNRIVGIEQKISCLTNPYFVKIIMEGNREILLNFLQKWLTETPMMSAASSSVIVL